MRYYMLAHKKGCSIVDLRRVEFVSSEKKILSVEYCGAKLEFHFDTIDESDEELGLLLNALNKFYEAHNQE